MTIFTPSRETPLGAYYPREPAASDRDPAGGGTFPEISHPPIFFAI